MGQSYERDRDRRGFKELAKLAGSSERPKAGSVSGIRRAKAENDSGMVDLHVLASEDPGAVDRASVTPLASDPLFGDDADATNRLPAIATTRQGSASTAPRQGSSIMPPPLPPSIPAPASSVAVPVSRASSSGPLVSPSVLRPIVSTTPLAPASAAALLAGTGSKTTPKKSPLARVGALAGLVALAAGAFFVVRSVRAPKVAGTEAVATAVHASEGTPGAGAIAQAPTPAPAANPGVDPLSLPKESAAAGVAQGRHVTHAWHGRGAQALAKGDSKEDDAPAAPVAKAEAAPKEAPAAPAPAGNNALLNSMKQAATVEAPASAAETPVAAAAASGPSGIAPRPSQGQVTGALGAVLPEARLCLNEDDGVSRAHVVFSSDGTVQSVSLSGFAAGKPVEGCIKTALTKAHVPAFAEATYGATVTVRP